MEFRLPNNTEHVSVIGQNGTGKTQLAAWLLSRASFDKMPWVIIDYKREQLFARTHGIQQLGLFGGRPPWKRPRRPGLYIIQPQPWEKDELEDFLYNIWRKGKCGVYFDEAHMIPKQEDGAFQALLTQGRSKQIPLIVLTQRPAYVSRFVMSEAKFFSIFHLNDRRDRDTVASFVPVPKDYDLPKYHSYWHDVGDRTTFVLQPVPEANIIRSRIEARLSERRSFWS